MQTEQDRLRALLDAGIALTSELSLDSLLQRLVEIAAELTGARYAALGVIDRTGNELERFVTHGVDAETHAAIGDLPRGRGILGVLIRDATPLRLREIGDDPRSVGFPSNHPPMHSFLGVPVVLRGVAFGNLYLTEKASGDFSQEDEDAVTVLAAQAAAAIENTRLYESATRWLRQLESLSEVGNALAGELELPRLLELIAERLRDLVDARFVAIALPVGDSLRFEVAVGTDTSEVVGLRAPADSKVQRVFERRHSERVDSVLDDPEVDQEMARRLGTRAALFVPLVVRDAAIGVMLASDKQGADRRFTEEDRRLAETFASRAAIAVELSTRVTRESLTRVVAAQELERRRLARELHDETGQALTSILLGLKGLEETEDPEARREALASLRELVSATLRDVRRLAVELRPSALDDFGLEPAVQRLGQTFSEQTGIRFDVEAHLGQERLPAEVETALYRIIQEALTNVVKHAQASSVSVVVTRQAEAAVAVIEDDGRGFDPARSSGGGLGLTGMRERIGLLDGRLQVESSPGGGTTIVAEVPLR